jgi:large conductance mechanosensitive channel
VLIFSFITVWIGLQAIKTIKGEVKSFHYVRRNSKNIVVEVKAIKELSTPAPEPPPPPKPKGFIEEFTAFLSKYGVVGLAVAFIIGGAASRLVQALVNDILMPIITFFIPGGAWKEATLTVGSIVLLLGHFVGTVIDFLIIAFVFWIMKAIEKTPLK